MFCLRGLSCICIRRAPSRSTFIRPYATQNHSSLDVSHSHFLAEASPKTKWKDEKSGSSKSKDERKDEKPDDLQGVTDTRGKLSPTSSHLFKLILPLGSISHPSNTQKWPGNSTKNNDSNSSSQTVPPTVILLHPSQPLSHVSKLILASIAPATPSISFRSISAHGGRAFQWSDSTDLGDFIRDAARSAEFTICISYGPKSLIKRLHARPENLDQQAEAETPIEPVDTAKHSKRAISEESGITETLITVSVPTFADRTRFLRRRLNLIEGRLHDMEGLKARCEAEAHHGARRVALGGFGMLVVYWAAVARLTFWDYGWGIMEPITYLSGLSTVILGYLWFLYQGREVSYASVLARSISARREALYKASGLDIERWIELLGERKALRAEIGRIAQDYEGDKDGDDGDVEGAKKGEDEDGLESDSESREADREGDRKHSLKSSEDVAEQATEELISGSTNNSRPKKSDLDKEQENVDQDKQKGKREAEKANRAGL